MYRNHTFTRERAHNTFTWLSPAHWSCICHALPKEGRPRLWLLLINFSAWLHTSPMLLSPIPGHLPHVRVYNGPMQEQSVETSICTIRSFLPVCLPVPHLTALSWPLTGPLMGLRLNHSEFFLGGKWGGILGHEESVRERVKGWPEIFHHLLFPKNGVPSQLRNNPNRHWHDPNRRSQPEQKTRVGHLTALLRHPNREHALCSWIIMNEHLFI